MASTFAQATSTGSGGAALRRMQELAQALYDSTPGLTEGKSIIIVIGV